MADDITKFKSLNYMSNRVVRNAMSGKKNDPDAGMLVTETASFSDTVTPQNYLMRSEITSDTTFTVASVTFHENSAVVTTTTPNGFSNVQVGDSIRPEGLGGYFYTILTKESPTQLVLNLEYSSPDGATTNTGVAQVMKREFGRAKLYAYSDPGQSGVDVFSYDAQLGMWMLGNDAASHKSGPYSTTSDQTASPYMDSIKGHSVPNGETGVADINLVGVLKKNLQPTQADNSVVIFSPSPNPSSLNEPGDTSKLAIKVKYPGQDWANLVYGEDYLLSYTNNPVYDGYRPLPSQVKSVIISMMKDFSYTENVDSGFAGKIAPVDSDKETINPVWGESIKVIAGDNLSPNESFMVDPLRGVVTIFDRVNKEELIGAVLYDKGAIYSGVEVRLSNDSMENITEDSYSSSKLLKENIDFTVNKENGTFYLLGESDPNKTLLLSYLVEGATRTTSQPAEDISDLRTDAFPVAPGSVRITATYKDGTKSKELSSSDYTIFYSNGVIRLNESYEGVFKAISIMYKPALMITALAKSVGENKFYFRVKDVPVLALNEMSIAVGFKDASLEVLTLTTKEGRDIPVAGSKYSKDNGVLTLAEASPTMAKAGYALVSFGYTSSSLPYYPLVRILRKLPQGSTNIVLESTSVSSLGLSVGGFLKFTSTTDPKAMEIVCIASIVNIDGVNVQVNFTQPTRRLIENLYWYASDSSVPWVGDIYQTSSAFAEKASQVTLEGVVPCQAACILSLEGNGLYQILGRSYEGGRTILSITPNLSAAISSTVSAQITEAPVYQEGDNGLSAKNAIMSEALPIATMYAPDIDEPTRFSLRKKGTTYTITKSTETTADVIFSEDSSGKTIKDTLDTLAEEFSGHVSYFADASDVPSDNLGVIVADVNPNQLPYVFKSYPTLYRKRLGETSYTALTQGVEYLSESGIIRLTEGNTIVKGDRFRLSYNYPSSQGSSTVTVSGKQFVSTVKGTQFNVSYDYLAPDQFYIETMKEGLFIYDWAIPYLTARKEALKGPKPLGSKGPLVVSTSTNIEGAVYNTISELRDIYLANNVLWKVSDYYKNRMLPFAKEYSSLLGLKAGNITDGSDPRTSWVDVCHQMCYGISEFFPSDYTSLTPVEDGRFAQTYSCCDTVAVYNDSTYGYIMGPYSNFKDVANGLRAGDKLVLEGSPNEYTIVSVDTAVKVTVTPPIEGATMDVPDFSGIKSFYGIHYSVIRNMPGEMYFVDDKGHHGAKAVSSLMGDVFVMQGVKNNFALEYSIDAGKTWVKQVVDLTENDTLPLPHYLSLKEVASILFDSLSTNFIVAVEDIYSWPSFSPQLQELLSFQWPLSIPDTGKLPGKRAALVIRARESKTWIRFSSTAPSNNVNLGFDKNTVYKGAYNVLNCKNMAEAEKEDRTALITEINKILGVSDKIDRSLSAGTLVSPVTLDLEIVTEHLEQLKNASAGASGIAYETDATAQVALSYTGANQAISVYSGYISETDTQKTKDTTRLSTISGGAAESYVCSFQGETLSRSEANGLLAQSFASENKGKLKLTSDFPSSVDPRVVYGTGAKDSTVPLGTDGVAKEVFPTYVNNAYMKGTYVSQPYGAWDSLSDSTKRYSSGASEIFRMDDALTITSTYPSGITISSTENGMTIIAGANTTYIAYDAYTNLANLVSKLNSLGVLSCTKNINYPDTTPYGTLVPIDTARVLSNGSSLTIPFGIKGDILFYTVSDDNLLTWKSEESSRISTVEGYLTYYPTRAAEIKNSFGVSGESLHNNREMWIKKLLHKTFGMAGFYLPAKKAVKESYEEQ